MKIALSKNVPCTSCINRDICKYTETLREYLAGNYPYNHALNDTSIKINGIVMCEHYKEPE